MKERYNSKYSVKARAFRSRDEQIGPVARQILRLFIKQPPLSAYDILSILKKRGDFPINSYKNIHKRVQRLVDLHFLTRDNSSKWVHNAIKYRLSSEGIFHLFLNTPEFLQEDVKAFIKNYGNDELFKEVYLTLRKNTIINLSHDYIFSSISDYLGDFCRQLNSMLEYEKKLELWNGQRDYPIESPIQLVTILPLHIRLLNSCKYLNDAKNDRDLQLLSQDEKFVQIVSDSLKDYEMVYEKLLSHRSASGTLN